MKKQNKMEKHWLTARQENEKLLQKIANTNSNLSVPFVLFFAFWSACLTFGGTEKIRKQGRKKTGRRKETIWRPFVFLGAVFLFFGQWIFIPQKKSTKYGNPAESPMAVSCICNARIALKSSRKPLAHAYLVTSRDNRMNQMHIIETNPHQTPNNRASNVSVPLWFPPEQTTRCLRVRWEITTFNVASTLKWQSTRP